MIFFNRRIILVLILFISFFPAILVSLYFGELIVFASFCLSAILCSVLLLPISSFFFFNTYNALPVLSFGLKMLGLWLLLGFIYCLPLIIIDYVRHGDLVFSQSLMDSYAALTTTGSSDILSRYGTSKTLIFWFGLLEWYGSFLTIIFFLLSSVFRGGASDFNWWVFIRVYILVSGIVFLSFLYSGIGWFDAFILSFSSISTGGILPYESSIYASSGIFATVLFTFYLLIFSLPVFVILHQICSSDRFNLFNIVLLRPFLKISFLIVIFIVSYSALSVYFGLLPSFESFFAKSVSMLSIVTTSGVRIFDSEVSMPLYWSFIFILAFVGMHGGSSASGLKLENMRILLNMIVTEISKIRYIYRYDRASRYGNNAYSYAFANFFGMLMILTISSIAITLEGEGGFSSILIALGYLVNTVNLLDYSGSVALVAVSEYSFVTKKLLILTMIVGRLEVVVVSVSLLCLYRRYVL